MSDIKSIAKHLLNQQKAKMGMYQAANTPVAQGQSVPRLSDKALEKLKQPILESGHHPQVYDAFLRHLKKATPKNG